MAKPKKYPEVMELEIGACVIVDGYWPAVCKAVAGYGARCKPQREFVCKERTPGNDGVLVYRLPDPIELPGGV